MTKKIESRILEQDLRCIKKKGENPILEGYVVIGFECTNCYLPREVRQNFPNEWIETVYKCDCGEKYLISGEGRNPFTPNVQDREAVENYKKLIPFLQITRGVQPQDEINLKI